MKLSKGLFVGAAVAVVLASGAGYWKVRSAADRTDNYITAPVAYGSVESQVVATGTLLPTNMVEVGAQIDGTVTSMNVILGQMVKPGDLIAVIDSFQLQNQVNRAQQQISQAQTQIRTATSNLQNQQSNLQRQESLAAQGYVTKASVDQLRYSVTATAATLAQQQMSVTDGEILLANAKDTLEKANIRAPIAGQIAEVTVRAGQTISTANTVPVIVKIATMDRMTVRAQISEADIIRIRSGLKVYFTVPGDPNRRYDATLKTFELTPVGGVLDPTAGGSLQKDAVYYNALFDVDNSDGRLLAGMSADVHIILDDAANVLTIPAQALGQPGANGAYTVQVIGAEGRPVARTVTIGLNDGTRAEVKSGLKEGDQVVIGQSTQGAEGGSAASEGLLSRMQIAALN